MSAVRGGRGGCARGGCCRAGGVAHSGRSRASPDVAARRRPDKLEPYTPAARSTLKLALRGVLAAARALGQRPRENSPGSRLAAAHTHLPGWEALLSGVRGVCAVWESEGARSVTPGERRWETRSGFLHPVPGCTPDTRAAPDALPRRFRCRTAAVVLQQHSQHTQLTSSQHTVLLTSSLLLAPRAPADEWVSSRRGCQLCC